MDNYHMSEESLAEAKGQLGKVLDTYPNAATFVLDRINAGQIQGDYLGELDGTDAPCCFIGTTAISEGTDWCNIRMTCGGIGGRDTRLIESMFYYIRRGDTPQTHFEARIVSDWIEEWMADRGAKQIEAEMPEVEACLVTR